MQPSCSAPSPSAPSRCLSSLAQPCTRSHNAAMTPEQATATLPLHPQDEVECRRCAVHCEKVVYPAACLERSCPFVYAYEEHGHTYMGCLQKVFEAEIDVEMLARRGADARGLRRRARAAGAAADVPVGGAVDVLAPRERARLRQSGVRRAAGRIADVPRLRAGRGLLARSRNRRRIRTPTAGPTAASDEREPPAVGGDDRDHRRSARDDDAEQRLLEAERRARARPIRRSRRRRRRRARSTTC